MSGLKVYWPECESPERDAATATQSVSHRNIDEPEIYSFAEWVEKLRGPGSASALFRAQRLDANQTCPDCNRSGAVPLTLNNGRIDNSGRMVPGSATLVGFRCEECCCEWSA